MQARSVDLAKSKFAICVFHVRGRRKDKKIDSIIILRSVVLYIAIRLTDVIRMYSCDFMKLSLTPEGTHLNVNSGTPAKLINLLIFRVYYVQLLFCFSRDSCAAITLIKICAHDNIYGPKPKI